MTRDNTGRVTTEVDVADDTSFAEHLMVPLDPHIAGHTCGRHQPRANEADSSD